MKKSEIEARELVDALGDIRAVIKADKVIEKTLTADFKLVIGEGEEIVGERYIGKVHMTTRKTVDTTALYAEYGISPEDVTRFTTMKTLPTMKVTAIK